MEKLLNGEIIQSWPWENPDLFHNSPFILQHALQDVLLSTPNARYQGFSKIIGTQTLNEIQDIFNSLATKFNPPQQVLEFIESFSSLKIDVENHKGLEYVVKDFSKNNIDSLQTRIENYVREFTNSQDKVVFIGNDVESDV